MVLMCKMCGGDIVLSPDKTTGTCKYCGTTMTLPKLDSEKKARSFSHADQTALLELIQEKEEKAQLLAKKEEKRRTTQKRIKWTAIVSGVVLALAVGVFLFYTYAIPAIRYAKASNSLNKENYQEAMDAFMELQSYKDAPQLLAQTRYQYATELFQKGDYVAAKEMYASCGPVKDTTQNIKECTYRMALAHMEKKEYQKAIETFETDYRDAQEKIEQCWYGLSQEAYEQARFEECIAYLDRIIDKENADAIKLYLDAAMTLQLTQQKYYPPLEIVKNALNEKQRYKIGSYLARINALDKAKEYLEGCLTYEDSADLYGDLLLMEYKNNLYMLYDLALGKPLTAIEPALGERAKCEKARLKFETLAEPIYLEGKELYDGQKWGQARSKLKQLAFSDYRDVAQLLATCEDRIETAKNQYNGIWLGKGSVPNLKIEDTRVYVSYSLDPKDDNGWMLCRSSFDEDTGVLAVTYGTLAGSRHSCGYQLSIEGKHLVARLVSQPEGKTPWLGEKAVFEGNR